MMIEFPSRKWNKYALHRLIKQIDATGTSNSRNCGRKRSARTADNIAQDQELICSQDNNPGTSKSPREIERATGGCLQQLVYREPILDVEHLKEVILCCWAEIAQALVNSAIEQWSSRVDAVIKARGGHNFIEYLFD